ncbi:palmitoyltransferase swf1 [Didymella exigua CBS 183.55]|uniref:Palmitoyltransferase n=1 Tax=Didymella exigua CBS 183.55 TaxID=1150837 RepID=A0A6A5RB23_9PLEO|nr:palmitoyltransferase swf1 [Didymella exigua CBS 183.55]KAF1922997.1 palmitoyltransferase swf1 [Didymella exigua CBS 183.55]
MALARTLVILALAVSFFTFVAFFGRLPALRNTPVGFLNRLFVRHLPAFVRRLDLALTNGRITSSSSRLAHHLMHDRHPVIVVFFLGLVTACATLLLPATWASLHPAHKLLAAALLPQPYLWLWLSAKRNASTHITRDNHAAQMRHYPYDRVLYHPGNTCSTCALVKPARSKHCSICKTCVARMDHHCIWVNNCLGRGNYKYFLLLLLSTGVLIAYGAHLAWVSLSPRVAAHYAKHESWYAYRPAPGSGAGGWAAWAAAKAHYAAVYATLYLDLGGLSTAGVGLLALLTWPLPLGLLAYHMYLVWAGMTTNESAKWADWRDDMADGVVFLGLRREDGIAGGADPLEEPPTSWPLDSRHVLVRTRDGQPPKALPPRIQRLAGPDAFERVWTLAAVENVYDLGMWDNLREVLWN